MQIRGESSPKVNGSLKGTGLNHRKLSPKGRISLAADVATGVRQVDLSHSQICDVFDVTPPALRAELKARAAANGNGHDDHVAQFVELWAGFSYAERAHAVQGIGVGDLWNVIAEVIA